MHGIRSTVRTCHGPSRPQGGSPCCRFAGALLPSLRGAEGPAAISFVESAFFRTGRNGEIASSASPPRNDAPGLCRPPCRLPDALVFVCAVIRFDRSSTRRNSRAIGPLTAAKRCLPRLAVIARGRRPDARASVPRSNTAAAGVWLTIIVHRVRCQRRHSARGNLVGSVCWHDHRQKRRDCVAALAMTLSRWPGRPNEV